MAFQQGLSGLNSSARALDVVSNNIANASTVGFKGAQAQFADVYAASLGVGGASNVGIGANAGVVQQRFSQGNISTSNNPLDLAVNGNGFFRMQKDPTNQTITYTRNGQFHLDDQGYIVNAQNLNLTGYPIENNVVNRAQLVPVQLDTSGVEPRATGAAATNPGIQTQINLDDREARSLTSASPDNLAPWSANGTTMPPSNLNTFNYSTSITVYDLKGNDHALSMYFTRIAPSDGLSPGKNMWEVHFVLDSTDITDAVVASTGEAGIPTLEFNGRGGIKTGGADPFTNGGYVSDEPLTLAADPLPATTFSSSLAAVPVAGSVVIKSGSLTLREGTDYTITAGNVVFNSNFPTVTVSYQTLDESTAALSDQHAVDFLFNIDVQNNPLFQAANSPFSGLFEDQIPISFDGSTLFGSGYDVNKLTQDGYPYGRLSGVSVSPDGVLRGSYSNGQTKDIAQLVLVDFIAPTGLMSLGNNQWGETAESGQPLIGDPGAGNRGLLQAAAVEDSNVDLTQELVNLITFQRNYQANAQSIKTQDQVLQTLVNLR